ncbi:MAG: hypothetical protein DLM54_08545 [Acidimicrobiales bacterium]|nr:MAG: hypothetical protein DLM54_08545 [Acidimicrobiales bacterium]
MSGRQEAFIKGASLQKTRALYFGDGLLTSDGDLHDSQRRLLQPIFHGRRMAQYGDVTVGLTQAHLAGWQPGAILDMHEEMRRLMPAVIVENLLSCHLGGDEAQVISALVSDGLDAMKTLTRPGYGARRRLRFPAVRRLQRVSRSLRAIVAGFMDRRGPLPDEDGDLISVLLRASACEASPGGHRLARDEVMTMLLAGHETTSDALAFAWYLLATHPHGCRTTPDRAGLGAGRSSSYCR